MELLLRVCDALDNALSVCFGDVVESMHLHSWFDYVSEVFYVQEDFLVDLLLLVYTS